HGEEARQADRERREDEMEADGERELQARQEDRIETIEHVRSPLWSRPRRAGGTRAAQACRAATWRLHYAACAARWLPPPSASMVSFSSVAFSSSRVSFSSLSAS